MRRLDCNKLIMLGLTLSLGACGTFTGNPFDGKKPGGGTTTGKNTNDPNIPGGGGEDPGGSGTGGTSTTGIMINLTGAPNDTLAHFWLNLAKIEVQGLESDWRELPISTRSIDLIALDDGTTKLLTEAKDLPSGTYKDMRITLDQNEPSKIVLSNGSEEKLSVSNLVIQGLVGAQGLMVEPTKQLGLTLDFDTQKSLVKKNGASDNEKGAGGDDRGQGKMRYELTPSIRLAETQKTGTITGKAPANMTIVCAYAPGASKDQTKDCSQSIRRTRVKDGQFKLTLLPEGSYELRFFDANSGHSDKSSESRSEAGKVKGD